MNNTVAYLPRTTAGEQMNNERTKRSAGNQNGTCSKSSTRTATQERKRTRKISKTPPAQAERTNAEISTKRTNAQQNVKNDRESPPPVEHLLNENERVNEKIVSGENERDRGMKRHEMRSEMQRETVSPGRMNNASQ